MRLSVRKPLRTLTPLLFAASGVLAQSPSMTLTPALVEAGSPELIRATAPANAHLEGEWQGHKLQFFPGSPSRANSKTHAPASARSGSHARRPLTSTAGFSAWYALAGVDVESPLGPSELKITIRVNDTARQIDSTITIHPAHYRTSSISVEPKFVEPGPEELKIIEAARQAKEKAFATTADQPLWSGSFVAPVPAKATDSFGTRRTFNGKLASIHKGADFRAASGTPVHAGNSGVVILAQPLYYEGNCVMIDHGLGLISISMHLSRIDVKPGDKVKKGQFIGLSGATGRVTGPHLHWAIRWQGSMLDPVKLLHLNLNGVL
jgi:murein DD-endopeptidase MepM/ murein hydrolase activator NlpD